MNQYLVSEVSDVMNPVNISKNMMRNYKRKNPFSNYRDLIRYLKNNNNIKIVNLRKLTEEKSHDDVLLVSLRHDIDRDIYTALKMAKLIDEENVLGTFYLLHTARYYGIFKNNKFYRTANIENTFKLLKNKNTEVGLHIDPLFINMKYNINGSQAVKTEIEWLRKIGLECDSVVSHNSSYYYGAENFQIFDELTNRKEFKMENKNTTLGTLKLQSEKVVETNFPILVEKEDLDMDPMIKKFKNVDQIRNISWLSEYFINNKIFKHGYNINIWTIHTDKWVIADNQTNNVQIVSFNEMIKLLDTLKGKCVFNLHPCYFSG